MADYIEEISTFLNSISALSDSSFGKIMSLSKFKEYDSNVKLVDFNENAQKVYLLCKGVSRSYVILDNGKELTKSLFTPLQFFSGFSSIIEQKPSKVIHETLTKCYVSEIDFYAFKKLCNENQEILKFYIKYLEDLFVVGENNYVEVISLDAKQRYLRLRERIPEIDNLIPQYQIASYLHITPVQLSRIRSKLY